MTTSTSGHAGSARQVATVDVSGASDTTGEHDPHRAHEDLDVGHERPVDEVLDVVAEFELGVGPVATFDLGEARQARREFVAADVAGDPLGDLLDEFGSFRDAARRATCRRGSHSTVAGVRRHASPASTSAPARSGRRRAWRGVRVRPLRRRRPSCGTSRTRTPLRHVRRGPGGRGPVRRRALGRTARRGRRSAARSGSSRG